MGVCSFGVDGETAGAAEDLDVVAVGRAVVVGALPSRLASDGSEVLLVESELTGSIAYEDPSGDTAWAMDGEVAGASEDAQRDRAVAAPGLVLTELSQLMTQEQKEANAAYTPLRRNAAPEDVAGAILLLASGHAGFVTGAYLPVSGGTYIP